MKEFEFKETSIIQEYTLVMGERYEVNWPAARTPGLYRTVMYTIAAILKNYKSKSKRIGFKLKDKNGEFKFGAILNYHAPEEGDNEDDDAGNYTLEFTFYEDDMTDLDAVYDNYSDIFIMCSNKYAHDIMNGKFCSAEYCNILFIEAINVLYKFLDVNASESEDVSVVYKSIFTATVTVEDGKKVFSIVPGEVIKQFIKGDSSL